MLELHEILFVDAMDIAYETFMLCSCLVNKIDDEGACAIAEFLKQNTTLIRLNLESML